MNRKIIISSLVALFCFSSTAFAHNGVVHHGKPIEGMATAVEATGFKVKTAGGEKTVEVNKDTVFEIGADEKKGTLQDLKEGASVMVEGTTLDSGVIVATEVMVHSDIAGGAPEHASHEHKSH